MQVAERSSVAWNRRAVLLRSMAELLCPLQSGRLLLESGRLLPDGTSRLVC